MCSQQVDPSLFTDRRKIAEKNFFLSQTCDAKSWKFEEKKFPKMRRWNEEFITFWKKLKCQSTWRTQSDAGAAIDTTVSVDGQHAISPTGPSRLSLSSFFFLNSRIVTLNPFQVQTLTTLSCLPSRKKNDFSVAGFCSETHFQYFLYTGFLFSRCRLPLISSLKVWFILKGSTLFSNAF